MAEMQNLLSEKPNLESKMCALLCWQDKRYKNLLSVLMRYCSNQVMTHLSWRTRYHFVDRCTFDSRSIYKSKYQYPLVVHKD